MACPKRIRSLKASHANHLQPARFASTVSPTHFYRNRQLELFASKKSKPLSLRQLVFFGRSMNEERLIKSANYVRTELPVRIAHRIRDMQTLPYVVVRQEQVAKVYELYWTAFDRIRGYPPVNNLEENEEFCRFLQGLLDEHSAAIPILSLGLSLSSPYLDPESLDSVLRRMLVSRISRRVLVQHHIALSAHLAGREPPGQPHVGIIHTNLDARECITRCASLLREGPQGRTRSADEEVWPEVQLDGDTDTHFAYIREHLEYPIFELLKNSMRFTRLAHLQDAKPPPIRVTIVTGPSDIHIRISDKGGGLGTLGIKSPSDLYSFSHIRNADRLANERIGALQRASQRRRGVMATVTEQMAVDDSEPAEDLQGHIINRRHLGIGLPMSKIYAEYFRGSLHLVSLDGFGLDAYLRLPKLGTMLEDIEV